ncbi:MAG: DUF4339 domain-containing protein [Pseudomonadota bacterium]
MIRLSPFAIAVFLLSIGFSLPGPGPASAQNTPPPPPALYHYVQNGTAQGPVPLAQIQALIASGAISRDTLVWRPGYAAWKKAGDDQTIAGLFSASPPPPPTGTAQPGAIQSGAPQGTAVAFRDQAVPDTGRGNFPAFHLLVPQGWTFEGKLIPVPAYSMVPYMGGFEVKAPDGRLVSFAPFNEFGYSDMVRLQPFQPYQGRPFLRRPNSLGDFLTAIAQYNPERRISDIQVVSEDVVPEATEMVRRTNAYGYNQARQYTQQNAARGETWTYDVHVRRVVMRYTEKGQRLESTTFAVIGSNTITYTNGAVKSANWLVTDAYSVGGPVGTDYVNDPVLAAIVRSRRINPDWAHAIDQWYAGARQQIIREGAAAAAAAQSNWSNTRGQKSDDVLDISFNGWKNRNTISDRSQSNLVNSIHERTTYATPSGQNVNLPSFYRNAFTDGRGNYVLHNDANYNINTDPTFNSRNWQRIQPVQ